MALVVKLRLKELAGQKDMSQSLLQRTSGVTMTMLRRYWNNDTDSWHRESLVKLAAALGVRVTDLIEEVEEESTLVGQAEREGVSDTSKS